MATEQSLPYLDAKARVVRCINRVATFIKASVDFNNDRTSTAKKAKIKNMIQELSDIRRNIESDIQIMESAVAKGVAPVEVKDNTCSSSLIDSFDTIYYELAAFADVHNFPLAPKVDASLSDSSNSNQSSGQNNLSCFQLPKRRFPTFSGVITEWQGFDDLFNSILSHAPDLSAVEKFEYLKTSLEGEALTLVSHLSLTAPNYLSAWEILRTRYGNKRDLSRIHLDALLAPHIVRSDDALSIKMLINSILEHTAALDNLEFATRTWSPLLVHIFEKHLDYELRSRWEFAVGDQHLPKVSVFVDFLRSYLRSAEVWSSNPSSPGRNVKAIAHQKFVQKPRPFGSTKILVATTSQSSVSTPSCPVCKHTHSIRQCSQFINQPPNERFQTVKKYQLCINCLGSGHSAAGCPSKHTCQSCKKHHHTLLHFPDITTARESSRNHPPISMLVGSAQPRSVLLSTLLINVRSIDNRTHTVRALLDTGAQVSFITKQCADRLSLPRRHCSTRISAFSGTSVNAVSGMTSITMSPVGKPEPSIPLDVLIVSKITDSVPQSTHTSVEWPHIKTLDLADPTFNVQSPVDILLGADVAPAILTGTRVAGHPSHPTAFGTLFGWVLLGPAMPMTNNSVTSLLVTTETSLEQSLTKFWEMEEPPHIQHLSPDEVQAESIFVSSIQRLESGRFSVALPFKAPRPILGDSRGMAQKRFCYLEDRLSRDPGLQKQYVDFMKDYVDSQHMEVVPTDQKPTPYCYYIPHHCILRPDSKTTKLRVVFDASAMTTAGQSLNNNLYTGRKLQQDLPQILIRARVHTVLFTADIKQMYRQIEIRPEDRDYLRILWRSDRKMPIEEYRLRTVTYGTSCAPHQALRTLQHLATIEGHSFPAAAKVLMQDTFVDDILTGADSDEAALACQQQIISLCAQGQFQLRKWASNSSEILKAVPASDCSISSAVLFDDEVETGLKILGMQWSPKQDYFSYTFQSPTSTTTKRSILSDLARIFDPLGFLAPITFLTKHLMQLLWTTGIGWDEPVPENVLNIWKRYHTELQCIQQVHITRRITMDGTITYQLHTFSDSSEKGYAAAVYLRCDNGVSVRCHLITAKSKVAPLKRVTIPRLELCGAVLAAKLLSFVHGVLKSMLPIDAMHAWTDSTTTLAWIQSSPHRWATFIANRTSQLQSLTPPSMWRYVPTTANPVDCASRGLYPSELLHHPMWWNGPAFLSQDISTWPPISKPSESELTDVEVRKITLLVTTHPSIFDQLFLRLSSLQKILRVITYCHKIVRKVKSHIVSPSPAELAHALKLIILAVQHQSFPEEYIRTHTQTHKGHSKLRGLNIFFDEHGICRVGGRLDNANIPYDQKHPILLPRSHRFTDLLIDDFHRNLKHPGATTLLGIIQQQYWIVSGRQVIRSRLRHCISCYRTRPREVQPQMGNLPKFRLQQVKPFMITGVDYAGPITLKSSPTRRTVPTQAYICLFICMTTKALHLELASDLSTETFLMAFSRFISRRGPVTQMHSDCGTNFVGASKLFQTVDQFTQTKEYQAKCRTYLTSRNISWHFNPPSAPHFGGLWEAGVKSVKTLMYRTIGLQRLTYEELTTLLNRIESTLNSRPLGALSSDPRDFEAITPSHFLTLMSSAANVDPDLDNTPLSRLQRWRLIKDIHAHFWKRWQSEYLQTLQRRPKWFTHEANLEVDTLVLIREPTAPLTWKIGRITQLHPGNDGIARVATIQTATGILKRPIVKLCPLPMS